MQPGLPRAGWKSPKRWCQLWHSFTLPLPATRSEVLGGISPPAHLIRCIGIQNNPPKSQICHAFCCHWKSTSSAQQSAPTAGSQGKANHTPNGLLWQEKPLPLAKCPGIAPTRPTVVRLRGPLPDWKRPAAEWPSKASQINPLAWGSGISNPGVHLLWMHLVPDRVLNLAFSLSRWSGVFDSRTQYQLLRVRAIRMP